MPNCPVHIVASALDMCSFIDSPLSSVFAKLADIFGHGCKGYLWKLGTGLEALANQLAQQSVGTFILEV